MSSVDSAHPSHLILLLPVTYCRLSHAFLSLSLRCKSDVCSVCQQTRGFGFLDSIVPAVLVGCSIWQHWWKGEWLWVLFFFFFFIVLVFILHFSFYLSVVHELLLLWHAHRCTTAFVILLTRLKQNLDHMFVQWLSFVGLGSVVCGLCETAKPLTCHRLNRGPLLQWHWRSWASFDWVESRAC